MPAEEKVKGPASYFPSIEKTYGQPIAHWQQVIADAGVISVSVQKLGLRGTGNPVVVSRLSVDKGVV